MLPGLPGLCPELRVLTRLRSGLRRIQGDGEVASLYALGTFGQFLSSV